MQAGVGLLVLDVMPIYMIIALDIIITMRFSINCSTVICVPTVCFLSREKPLMKSMAHGSIFYHIIFRSIKSKTQNYLAVIYLLLFYFALLLIFYIYHYQISSLRVTVKGLTTPLSRWVQVFVCLCRYKYWRLVCSSYWIDTLVLNWAKYLSLLCCITLSSSREKQTQAQEVAQLYVNELWWSPC
jgi:hypothetical protein